MGDASDNTASLLGHLGILEVPRPLSRRSGRGEPSVSPTALPDIPLGCEVRLAANRVPGLLRQRLIDLGFTPGAALRLVRRGPRGNLIAVSVRDTIIALRSEEARLLLVSYDNAGE